MPPTVLLTRSRKSHPTDSRVEIELAHHPVRCLESLTYLGPWWLTYSSRGSGLKLRLTGWLAQQIIEAFPWDTAPRYLIRDNGGAYGQAFIRRIRAMGIRDRPISPRSPWRNAYIERLIGTLRRGWIGRGCAATTNSPTIRHHRDHSDPLRITSSLRADLIFGKDRSAGFQLCDNTMRPRTDRSRNARSASAACSIGHTVVGKGWMPPLSYSLNNSTQHAAVSRGAHCR